MGSLETGLKSNPTSIGQKLNKLFLGAASIALVVTLVVACVLVRIDTSNHEYRSLERVKALLEAQLPLLASDLRQKTFVPLRTRLNVLVATQSPAGLEVAVTDQKGNEIYRSDGFVELGSLNKTSEGLSSEGYAISTRPIRSGLDILGQAVFAIRIPPQSSRVIGQSLAASLLVLIFVLTVLLVATQRYIMRTVVRPIEGLIEKLPALHRYVEGKESPLPGLPQCSSFELSALSDALWQTHLQLRSTLEKEHELRLASAQKEIKLRLSSQVAHDIRSPLAALDMILDDLGGLEEPRRLLLRRAVARIKDIANNLVEASRKDFTGQSYILGKPTIKWLPGIIDSILSEKRTLFSNRTGIAFNFHIRENARGVFASVVPGVLRSALSNLINNAVESIDQSGTVQVSLFCNEPFAVIRILDSGKGIPQSVLSHVGTLGFTYGKQNGSGQGVAHAKEAVSHWGGTLSISSQEGKGTCVEMRLPMAIPPTWFAEKITLERGGCVVVLDDDSSVRELWKRRFATYREKYELHVVFAENPEEFEKQVVHCPETTLYLMDYELIGHKATGLDLIKKYRLSPKSILVSSRFEDSYVMEQCLEQNLKVLPKALSGFVEIEVRDWELSPPRYTRTENLTSRPTIL